MQHPFQLHVVGAKTAILASYYPMLSTTQSWPPLGPSLNIPASTRLYLQMQQPMPPHASSTNTPKTCANGTDTKTLKQLSRNNSPTQLNPSISEPFTTATQATPTVHFANSFTTCSTPMAVYNPTNFNSIIPNSRNYGTPTHHLNYSLIRSRNVWTNEFRSMSHRLREWRLSSRCTTE